MSETVERRKRYRLPVGKEMFHSGYPIRALSMNQVPDYIVGAPSGRAFTTRCPGFGEIPEKHVEDRGSPRQDSQGGREIEVHLATMNGGCDLLNERVSAERANHCNHASTAVACKRLAGCATAEAMALPGRSSYSESKHGWPHFPV